MLIIKNRVSSVPDMEFFWLTSLEDLFSKLQSKKEGLTSDEAQKRLQGGANIVSLTQKWKRLKLFLSQIKNPLLLLLLGASILSFFLGSTLDASLILIIISVGVLLGYFQEKGAINALDQVLRLVETKIVVLRDGKTREIPAHQAVPGDVLILNSGDLIPADCRLFETHHLFIDESTLTGESFPVEKNCAEKSALFYGSMVTSGFGKALIVHTGENTKYGALVKELKFKAPTTSFEMGIRNFSLFLTSVTLLLVIFLFILNLFFARPFLESLLFSVALAVGFTPQLLPAIISINLSHGAKKMALKKVLIKRLPSIENLGQMDILCVDKTGTLTEGNLRFEKAVDLNGNECADCRLLAFLNASFQSGYTNPLDQALLNIENKPDITAFEKIDEIPFDFTHKRVSVFVKKGEEQFLITKGALEQILEICSFLDDSKKQEIWSYFEKISQEGYRTIAIAKGFEKKEEGLTFLGFLQFVDPIKKDITATVNELQKLGIKLKIITGDHHSVAMHVANAIALHNVQFITGSNLRKADSDSFQQIIKEKNVFAEIEPDQKKAIILALRKNGETVGFLGDGINDVAAIHSADVGISVDSGTEAAKEAADIVLLEKNLHVLKQGVVEGRHTFANTLKYIYMATSANFGNMFSMAAISLFLPFLPLLPKQVLLNNLLTDLPEMSIAQDNVDPELVRKPSEWNLPSIRRFMLSFGLLSSLFDFATFGTLLYYLKANEALFRTGWFVESVMSATLIVFVIRTRRSFFKSRPSKLLTLAIVGMCAVAMLIPYTWLGTAFGFVPIPAAFYLPLGGILGLYLLSAEMLKRFVRFY